MIKSISKQNEQKKESLKQATQEYSSSDWPPSRSGGTGSVKSVSDTYKSASVQAIKYMIADVITT